LRLRFAENIDAVLPMSPRQKLRRAALVFAERSSRRERNDSTMGKRFWRIMLASLAMGIPELAGCASHPPPPIVHLGAAPALPGLTSLTLNDQLDAAIDPPLNWRRDKFDVDAKHVHAVWLSPTGDTAYGVVLMYLPLPVGPEMVLWGFLNHMRQTDRQADLLNKQKAPDLPGIRFTAESGQYRIRVNLIVRDWRAWAVYAGTVKDRPTNPNELQLAETARDHTEVGIPVQSAAVR
jgi:hypothetical protein